MPTPAAQNNASVVSWCLCLDSEPVHGLHGRQGYPTAVGAEQQGGKEGPPGEDDLTWKISRLRNNRFYGLH